ncbi:MAG: hypothetical protein E5W28_06950 [Mesorhizobium sp.]|nr:MAG: hypothetical protein E5W28_06950 [Mesorhizobium sp.]
MRIFDISSFDNPRCAHAILLGRDDAGAKLAKDRRRAQIEHAGGFSQRDFAALGPLVMYGHMWNVRPIASDERPIELVPNI